MFVKGISEIVLIVKDFTAAARFYRDVVGLELEIEPSEDWAWFLIGAEGRRQRLALHRGALLFEEHSPRPVGIRFGAVHFTLEVSPERLEDAATHLRSHGVDVYGPTRFDWMNAKSYYFFDLDGNLVEFWAPDVVEKHEAQ